MLENLKKKLFAYFPRYYKYCLTATCKIQITSLILRSVLFKCRFSQKQSPQKSPDSEFLQE